MNAMTKDVDYRIAVVVALAEELTKLDLKDAAAVALVKTLRRAALEAQSTWWLYGNGMG